MNPTDTLQHVLEIIGLLLTAAVWIVTRLRAQERERTQNEGKFKALVDKNEQIDTHLESTDEEVKFLEMDIKKFQDQISDFKVMNERINNLQKGQDEQRNRAEKMDLKLDKIYNLLSSRPMGNHGKGNQNSY